jgi:hypothetical protein
MHELTIATGAVTDTTGYRDFDDALRALRSHVIAHDLYLHTEEHHPSASAAFTLVDLDEAARKRRIVGTATITQAADKTVVGPHYSAAAALHWTAEHTTTWLHGSDTDPGVRYPLAVLTTARAEARTWSTVGTLYREAARLSDAASPDVPRPEAHLVERLRDSAAAAARAHTVTTPAELADAVTAHLTPDISPAQAATLIWYYALILWGSSAP